VSLRDPATAGGDVEPRPPAPAGDARPALTGLTREELREVLSGWGEPAYRADQVFSAVWRRGVLDPAAMTTLPKALRDRLSEAFRPAAASVLEVERSKDGTEKALLGLADGARVETVLIPDRDRATVCVSTQVGCPVACVFCASGVGGLVRNLTTAEVAEQPLHVARRRGARPTHVVVMGMGEPLLNLRALVPAIRIWTDPQGLGFSPRRVTVSTAASGRLVDRLAETGLGVPLAVSLHGPDDETRRRLVPTSPPGRVEDLVDAVSRYARKTGRDATVEYVLIEGWNDAPEHAEALARRLQGRHVHVNLIPLNPVPHRPDLRPPSGIAAKAFARRLREEGVHATLRARHGEDIAAACGQLALERAVGGREGLARAPSPEGAARESSPGGTAPAE
jgi:23S rRNA (adenine2503-C2)-methyltransferase